MFRLLPLLFVPAVLVAADPPKAKPPAQGTKYAFLVGAAGYEHLQKIDGQETVNDVVEFRKALLATGFKDEHIVMLHDRQSDVKGGGKGNRYLPEHDKIVKELDLFLDGLTAADTVVVALSGHGVLFKGEKSGYFCPTDASLSPRAKLIPMDGDGGIYTRLEKCKAGRKLLLSNTCRDAPSVAVRDDLAGDKIELADDYPEAVPKGIAAFYSCEPGQKSYFDPKRGRSLFYLHLTDAWAAGGTLEAVFEATRVKTKTDANATKAAKQFPVVKRQYEGDWVIPGPIRWPGEDDYRKARRYEDDWPYYVAFARSDLHDQYQRAAEAGHPLAKIERATHLRKSYGSDQSVREAETLERDALPIIREATERNSAAAEFYLGFMYLQGIGGLPKDEVEGLKRIHTAAEGNDVQAQIWLAKSYATGERVEKDPAVGLKWLERAATQGNSWGQILLATAHFGGTPYGIDNSWKVERDVKTGLKWLLKSAEQDNPTAQLLLGQLYLDENNEGVVKKDIDVAVKWLRKAAAQGSEMAKESLEKIGKSPQ